MNEDRKKLLTEYLGECWHIFIDNAIYFDYGHCTKCGNWRQKLGNIAYHTFTTPDDMDALRRKLVEKGDFRRFLEEGAWVHYELDVNTARIRQIKMEESCYIEWLLDPARFCSLVGEWLERKGAKDGKE